MFIENKDQSLKPIRTDTRIRFTEDFGIEEPVKLKRVPTPHLKNMRAFAKVLLENKKKNVKIFLIIIYKFYYYYYYYLI